MNPEPELKGRKMFEDAGGIVLHSSRLQSFAITREKDVVMVGFSKSATDIVMQVSQRGNPRSVSVV